MRRLRYGKHRTGHGPQLVKAIEKTAKVFRVTLELAFYEGITTEDLKARMLLAVQHQAMPKGHVLVTVDEVSQAVSEEENGLSVE